MPASLKSSKKHQSRRRPKFRSLLEKVFAERLHDLELPAKFEAETFEYVKKSHYTPDFKIGPNTFIETKGHFSSADRGKLLAFKDQYPQVTIILVFGRAKNFLSKKSDTTYGEWATKHGFEWIDIKENIPKSWWNF